MLYLLQTAIIWAVLYWLFLLFFQQETFFRANRFYLLGALAAGLLLPLLPIANLANKAPVDVAVLLSPIAAVNTALQNTIEIAPDAGWMNWQSGFWLLYTLGMLVKGRYFIMGCLQLRRLVKRFGLKKTAQRLWLVEVPDIAQPFSFFNILFQNFSPAVTPGDRQLIELHETAHIRQWHSLDVLFLEILTIFFWFNPFVYKYKNALRTVHEFLADQAVLRHTNIQHYGHLLIRQAQSGPVPVLTNHFSHAQLKQRILMMTQSKSHPARRWKYTLALPVALIVFSLLHAAQAIAQKATGYYTDITRPTEVSVDTVVTFDPKTFKENVNITKTDIYTKVDQMPRYIVPGSTCEDLALAGRDACALAAFTAELQQKIALPEEVKSGRVKGRVIFKAQITNRGGVWILTPEPVQKLSPACDKAAYTALKALQGKWIAGKLGGQAVGTEILIPVDF